jgi:CBS domain-containing protein
MAAQTPRLLKQMADNALRNSPALSWSGAIDTQAQGGRQVVDLKLHGTMIYVDAARLFALAQGVAATGTRARFEAAAPAMGVPAREAGAWSDGFEVLQLMRLQIQLERGNNAVAADADPGNPNLLDVSQLNDLDRRLLKESLRVARRLQQRLELDFGR